VTRGADKAVKLLTEIESTAARFARDKHFCPWLRRCPDTKIRAAKVPSSGTGGRPIGRGRL
jgi:hypothetical protein